MKTAITGHTSGIGKALFESFDDVIGFSRSTGFNISSPDRIVDMISDCELFINNAHNGFDQVVLLYKVWEQWQDSDKLIICISSNSSDGIKNTVHPYAIQKAALDKACEQLNNQKKLCKIICVKPGYVDTPRIKAITEPKINTADLINIIRSLIDGWKNKTFFVSVITILPIN